MTKRSFGQISRLPSKRFRARYTGPDGALHSAPHTFDTRVDAEAWLTDERRSISSGKWQPPKARVEAARLEADARRSRSFAAYSQAWLDDHHDLKPTTRASYASSLRVHLLPAFGTRLIDEISTADVQRWFSSYGGRTPTARAHAYAVLAQIMARAVDEGLIPRTPCRVRSGGRTKSRREPEVLTLPELLALAEAMPQQHRALTLLSGLCGLRFGEAVALRRRDVNLDAGTVEIKRTMIRAEGEKIAVAPKTRESRRRVAMPKIVVDELRAHMATQPEASRDALVFPGQDGGLLAPSTLHGRASRTETRGGHTYVKTSYGFYGAREAIGRPGLHWHDLRRTAATLGAQSGATVREMQARLGHSTPAMALHYQQATAERDRAIADRLQADVDALGEEAPPPDPSKHAAS